MSMHMSHDEIIDVYTKRIKLNKTIFDVLDNGPAEMEFFSKIVDGFECNIEDISKLLDYLLSHLEDAKALITGGSDKDLLRFAIRGILSLENFVEATDDEVCTLIINDILKVQKTLLSGAV